MGVTAGVDFLCLSHPGRSILTLPDEKDVFEGVMASRVAARVGEGGSGPPAGPGA